MKKFYSLLFCSG